MNMLFFHFTRVNQGKENEKTMLRPRLGEPVCVCGCFH